MPPSVLLIGTSAACSQLAAQLAAMAEAPTIAGWILADPPEAANNNAPILGTVDHIDACLATFAGQHITAIVSVPASQRACALRVSSALRRHGVPERSVQPMEELLRGGSIAPVSLIPSAPDYAALIGRTACGIDRKAVARVIEGRRVLITGAGGSIGSEISRIVASFKPERIILMERSENALFEIDRKIGARFPGLPRTGVLHDVVDAEATLQWLQKHKPHVVFHAAAHKHVPLMEDHPAHAVNNNFFGTKSIADASLAVGVERFVLISSDKAVKPTSVMGATKRLAEMYIQGLHRSVWSRHKLPGSPAHSAHTAFCMVRFGNVLGSACSVLPIWTSQLSEGGPVTVTDPRMTRYFMTIDEAAALVIQAGAIDTSDPTAHVYVLDMGDPVRILDLARRFVRAAGFSPRIEDQAGKPVEPAGSEPGSPDLPAMPIRLTGTRPGEKLHEQLAYAAELLRPTPYPGINAWAGPLGDDFSMAALVADLGSARSARDRSVVTSAIRKHIPELPEQIPAPKSDQQGLGTDLPSNPDGNREDADSRPNMPIVAA